MRYRLRTLLISAIASGICFAALGGAYAGSAALSMNPPGNIAGAVCVGAFCSGLVGISMGLIAFVIAASTPHCSLRTLSIALVFVPALLATALLIRFAPQPKIAERFSDLRTSFDESSIATVKGRVTCTGSWFTGTPKVVIGVDGKELTTTVQPDGSFSIRIPAALARKDWSISVIDANGTYTPKLVHMD